MLGQTLLLETRSSPLTTKIITNPDSVDVAKNKLHETAGGNANHVVIWLYKGKKKIMEKKIKKKVYVSNGARHDLHLCLPADNQTHFLARRVQFIHVCMKRRHPA